MAADGFARKIDALQRRLDAVHTRLAQAPPASQKVLARFHRQALALIEELQRARRALQDENRRLAASHEVARLLHDENTPRGTLLRQVAGAVRRGMRHSRQVAVRVTLGDRQYATRNFSPGRRRLDAGFRTSDGQRGLVEVVCRERPPAMDGAPFTAGDEALVRSVAQMLTVYLDRHGAREDLRQASRRLEARVEERAALLESVNAALRAEIAERKRMERAMREALIESRRRQEEIAALLTGARSVLEHHDFPTAARAIFDACKDLVGATAGYVALLSQDGSANEIVFLDAGGLPCSVDPSLPMPIRGLRGEAYGTGRAVFDNDFAHSEHMRFMPPGHCGLDNVLFAPLVLRDRVVGLMGLANKTGGFTRHDASLATAFGELAAVALMNSRALESLERSEARFRRFAETIQDVFWMRTPDLARTVYVSPAYERIWGRPCQGLYDDPRSFLAAVHPEDRARVEGGLAEHAAGTWNLEYRVLRPDGAVRWVRDRGYPVHDPTTGDLVMMTGIATDITDQKDAEAELERLLSRQQRYSALLQKARDRLEERVESRTAELAEANFTLQDEIQERRQAEEALRLSQARLAGAQRIAHLGNWDWDIARNDLWWSDEVYRIFGVAPQQFRATYEGFLACVHPDDRAAVDGAVRGALDGRGPYGVDHRVVRPDGTERIVHEEAEVTRDADGRPVTMRGTVQDVTAARRAERELRESHELLERMFSSTHILIAYMDRDFNFIRVNRAYAEADGREPAFFIGRNHFDLYPDEENERIFGQVARTGRPFSVEAKPFRYAEHPERGLSYWDWTLQPVRDAQGQVSGVVLSLLDVTERVRSQERLEGERLRLFSVLNMLPGFVLLLGEDNTVQFANHRFLDLFGDPAGRPCAAVMRGRDEPCGVGHVEEVRATGDPREWDWASEAGRDYHVWGYPFSDSDGSRLVLELGIDITERRGLEREILQISGEERRRIGRDLHDVLGQNLSGISFLSKVLAQRLGSSGSPEASQAAEIASLVSQTIAQTRAISRGLCPVELTEEGLMKALQEMAARTERVFGIRCTFDCALPILVYDTAVATHLYHIAQEAVNNATRHARPTHVAIRLAEEEGEVALTVRDDGVGIGEPPREAKGMGLRIMRYRADIIGASLDIRRLAEGGTSVTCAVPVQVVTRRR